MTHTRGRTPTQTWTAWSSGRSPSCWGSPSPRPGRLPLLPAPPTGSALSCPRTTTRTCRRRGPRCGPGRSGTSEGSGSRALPLALLSDGECLAGRRHGHVQAARDTSRATRLSRWTSSLGVASETSSWRMEQSYALKAACPPGHPAHVPSRTHKLLSSKRSDAPSPLSEILHPSSCV